MRPVECSESRQGSDWKKRKGESMVSSQARCLNEAARPARSFTADEVNGFPDLMSAGIAHKTHQSSMKKRCDDEKTIATYCSVPSIHSGPTKSRVLSKVWRISYLSKQRVDPWLGKRSISGIPCRFLITEHSRVPLPSQMSFPFSPTP